jgi:hypothetical protein
VSLIVFWGLQHLSGFFGASHCIAYGAVHDIIIGIAGDMGHEMGKDIPLAGRKKGHSTLTC